VPGEKRPAIGSGGSVMTARLCTTSLAALPGDVERPRYDRGAVTPGIVHLGLGAFHRAHQAVYVDDCLGQGQSEWGIVGVSLRGTETRDALAPQDGLYALSVQDGAGERLRIVGSVIGCLAAAEDRGAVLDALVDPRIRIVSLTVTEKAYLRGPGGGLDAGHADIVRDLAAPAQPVTLHGFLAEAVSRRRAAGSPAFTVLCCDNLPANGATLKRVFLDFCRLRGGDLADFVAEAVRFPSTMVDRIVPATTEADRRRISARLGLTDAWPINTEPFSQWVVEDDFAAGRPDWERFGVTMVADVRPFEEMKLRLLNGAHSSMSYLGLLLGRPTVAEAFGDPAIRAFVAGLWAEAITTLPAGLDTADYTARLSSRFDNAALKHQTAQIANDGSQKLPQRLLASALDRLAAGRPCPHLALGVAAWIVACGARGDTLPAGHFTDPFDAQLSAELATARPARQTVEAVFELTGFAVGAPGRQGLVDAVAEQLGRIRAAGVAAALQGLA